jgi:hypothetical protein
VLGYLGQVVYAGIVVLLQRLKIKDTIVSILTFPLFIVSWIPINFYCLFKKNIGWKPIEHNNKTNIAQIHVDSTVYRFAPRLKQVGTAMPSERQSDKKQLEKG